MRTVCCNAPCQFSVSATLRCPPSEISISTVLRVSEFKNCAALSGYRVLKLDFKSLQLLADHG